MDEFSRTSLAARVVESWRGLPEAEKRLLRLDAVLDRTISSMAMAGEPVSQEWIDQARLQRVRRNGQIDDGHVSDL